ncbi:hypothetical protein K1719_046060 [Acacia pycnantha]|nr:hypothetical protein K1719_046060 [Acacia pycnantha]
MCVELDLTKPLVPEFNVEGQLLSVVYESLGQLCNKCGMVGHTKEGCEKFHNKRNEEGMEVEEPIGAQDKEKSMGEDREVWKMVQRPRRGGRSSKGNVSAQEKGKMEEGQMKNNQFQQWRKGRKDGMGESYRGAGSSKNKSVGRAEQDGKKDRDGRGKSGILANKIFTMMKILVWNNRGAASKGFVVVLRDMKCRYRLDLFVILEPRISGNLASKVIKSWGFKHSVKMETVGFSGGLWLRGEELLSTTIYARPN